MRIYSMTATFGKLEHEKLTLEPGLNVIQAPNEWGKSTWCAFLICMLYGIETSARESRGVLPDKTRYAPWSGKPMSGSMDIHWNGKDITLQRGPKGRIPFGDFKAFETDTGLAVPELTAANCGQTLLGVERSVFARAGFLKLTDLPVTQDDALRRRLNALVTTGDESGTGDALAQTLKDLKNRCRHNRTGLLPQAEAQQQELEAKLQQLQSLENQSQRIQQRQQELTERIAALENHKDALRYAASQGDAQRVAAAQAAEVAARQTCEELEAVCRKLPARQEAEQSLQAAQALLQQRASLQMEAQMLPSLPAQPETPSMFQGQTPEDAVAAAQESYRQVTVLEAGRKKNSRLVWGFCGFAALVAAVMAVLALGFSVKDPLLYLLGGGAIVLGGVLVLVLCYIWTNRFRREMDALYDRYPGLTPSRWVPEAESYAALWRNYRQNFGEVQALRGDLDSRTAALEQKIVAYTKNSSLQAAIAGNQDAIGAWNALDSARRDLQQAQRHAQDVAQMAKSAEPPKFPDTLTYTADETEAQLQSAHYEQRQLHIKLGQCQGQMAHTGQEEALQRQLSLVNGRIARLEDTYAALEIAQDALVITTQELQRRFAPRISRRAQALFGQLTGGRYDRLTLGEDLNLSVGAQDQDTLCSTQYPSDGTVDQLYLALRLAVAQELTPEAPLVLDDALVRFDDTRLQAAMEVLRQEAQSKQVILFTCQSRETNL